MSKFQKLKLYGVYVFEIKEDKKIPAIVVSQHKDELFIIPITKRTFNTDDKFFIEILYKGVLTYACVFRMMKVNLKQKRTGRNFLLSEYDQLQIKNSIKRVFGI